MAAPSPAGDAGSPRPAGRPRGPSSATEYAVLSAAWRILTDEGITALTPTRLHAETGVARTTIYRHWPDASAVVADIVAGASRRRVPAELTGDLRADLSAALETLTFRLRHRPVGSLLGALLAADARPGTGGPATSDYVRALLAPIREVIVAGLERGALSSPGRLDADALLHEFVGPLLLDVVLLGGDADRLDDAAIVDAFLRRHAVADDAPPVADAPAADGPADPASSPGTDGR
ncbi:MAG: TetR/AcrR family transcriptional regulator [Actinomycetota bacterium]